MATASATGTPYSSASSWNGRTSTGSRQAAEPLAAQSSAASRSAAWMTQSPPSCSLVFANGPSVVTTWPLWARTTVAVEGGCSPPPNTQAPAAWSSALKASTASYACWFFSSGRGEAPSTMCTASRYCFMSISLHLGRRLASPSTLFTNGVRRNRHPARRYPASPASAVGWPAATPGERLGAGAPKGVLPCIKYRWSGAGASRPDLDHAALDDPRVERGLACRRGPVHDGPVAEPEHAAVPGTGDARIVLSTGERPLVQRPAQVRAPVGQGQHVRALADHDEAEVAELAPGYAAVGQVVDTAQVVPAERGKVRYRFCVAGPSAEWESQVPAEVGACRQGGEPAERKRPAFGVPADRPCQQRASEQRRRAGIGGRVHDADPLLLPVQRRPVRQSGGRGWHRPGEPEGDQHLGGPP